jgi:hypothetical protein
MARGGGERKIKLKIKGRRIKNIYRPMEVEGKCLKGPVKVGYWPWRSYSDEWGGNK